MLPAPAPDREHCNSTRRRAARDRAWPPEITRRQSSGPAPPPPARVLRARCPLAPALSRRATQAPPPPRSAPPRRRARDARIRRASARPAWHDALNFTARIEAAPCEHPAARRCAATHLVRAACAPPPPRAAAADTACSAPALLGASGRCVAYARPPAPRGGARPGCARERQDNEQRAASPHRAAHAAAYKSSQASACPQLSVQAGPARPHGPAAVAAAPAVSRAPLILAPITPRGRRLVAAPPGARHRLASRLAGPGRDARRARAAASACPVLAPAARRAGQHGPPHAPGDSRS